VIAFDHRGFGNSRESADGPGAATSSMTSRRSSTNSA
jgi:hypothetical protein